MEKKEILLWRSIAPYDKVKQILTAKFKESNEIKNIFFFKGKYECLITSHQRKISFWNIKTYQYETVLTDRKCLIESAVVLIACINLMKKKLYLEI